MNKAKVLIVEDSFIVGFHLQKTLERERYEVTGIEASGEAALLSIERQRPEIVLMDIMLEGKLDGIETARRIKNTHNLPVIFLTALSDNVTIERAKFAEPYGYLTKPFEEREIQTTIEMALYKHQAELKLRASEEKYFSTVKSISDAVILVDNNYNITYMNPKAEYLTGWTLPETRDRSVFNFFLLRDTLTDEFPINPFQCNVSGGRNSTLLADLMLISKEARECPIGEGSMSAITNSSNQCIGMVIIFKDISEKLAHETLIKEFEKNRLAAIIEGQEAERSRVAKDLHDGLGQILTAVKINLNLNASPDLKKVNMLIEEAIQESVRIAENLLPLKLKDFDLQTCLRSMCNQVSSLTNSNVNFETLGTIPDINHVQKINLFRIAQEAVNNAIKHAGANAIFVQLNGDENRIQLTVEDDGVGFEEQNLLPASGHHGLENMKQRTNIMDGKLTIESDAKRGTLIVVETPVKI